MESNVKKFSPRYQSRELSLKVLFSYSQNKRVSIDNNFNYIKENFFPKLKKTEFATEILSTYIENNSKISSYIKEFATKWSFEKQNPVDLVILELLITEILYIKTPYKVAISEYLTLSSDYSKESSFSFINGVVAKIIDKYGESSEEIRD